MKFSVTELTQSLLASYRRHGGINHLDGVNLPSKGVVVDITRDLLRLVFPGFFDDHVIHSSELQAETAMLLDSVAGRREDEIYKSLRCFECADEAKRDPRRASQQAHGGAQPRQSPGPAPHPAPQGQAHPARPRSGGLSRGMWHRR